MTVETKDTNPKDAIGMTKLPMHLIPGTAKAYLAIAFLEGALKYGKYNWRVSGVRASIYLDAMERHMEKFKNGEWSDPVTHVPHLASIMACSAIILDADAVGKLNDDRPPKGDEPAVIDALQNEVLYLQELYAGENPAQHTIEEPRCPPESQPMPTTKSTTPLVRLKSSEPLAIRPGETPSSGEQ